MADSNVFIEGAAEGAFVDALSGLPPWATESTAWKIQGILEKQLGVQNKMLAQLVKNVSGNGNGTLSPADQQKANKEFENLIKHLSETNKAADKDKKRRKDREEADKRSILTSNKLKTSGEKLTYVLTGLATIGSKVLQAETQYIKTYDALYESGINLLAGNNSTTDGFKSLNQMVNLTGMKLETLQKTFQQFSETINAVGATKFTKALAKAIPQLTQLGFTSEQSSELLASYMDIQKNVTDIRVQTEKELIANSVEFGKELTKMSLATGKSREQLLENLRSTAKQNDFALIAAQNGDKAANNIMEFAAKFGKGTQDMLMRFASASAAELSDQYQALNAAGQGELAARLKDIARLAQTDKEAAQSQIESLKPLIDNALKSGGLRELRDTKHAGAEETVTALAELRTGIISQSKATKEQTDAAINTKAATASLKTEMERSAAIVEAAFSPMVSQVNAAATGLKLLNDQIYRGIGAFEQETRSWIGLGLIVAGFGATLAGLISKVGRFASLFSSGSAAGGAAAAGGGGGAAAAGGAAVGGGVGLAAAGLVALPAAIAGTGAYLQHEMNTPEGRARRVEEQKKRLAEKKEILRAYKEQGATGKAVKQVEDEIAQHEKLITDLSVDRAKVQTQLPKTKTPSGSTIAAPVVETEKPKEEVVTSPSAGTVSNAGGPVKQPPPANSDINSQLAYQNSVLEQILMSSQNLVSVNKDILKYTRVQS